MGILSVSPNEGGTLKIKATFTDEDGKLIPQSALKSVKWQLMDADGNIVNGKSFDTCIVSSPESTIVIILSGDDLLIDDEIDDRGLRVFAIWVIYDSTYGMNLPMRDEISFRIKNLISVTKT